MAYQILKITDQVSDRAVDLLHQYFLSHNLLIADGLTDKQERSNKMVNDEILTRTYEVAPDSLWKE
jgi:hypothetical protein